MNIDLSFISDYAIVVLACLALGYVLKNWIKDVDNKYIPTILCIVGAITGCIAKGTISLENIVYGAIAGLASTGMHQVFKQMIENKKETNVEVEKANEKEIK